MGDLILILTFLDHKIFAVITWDGCNVLSKATFLIVL